VLGLEYLLDILGINGSPADIAAGHTPWILIACGQCNGRWHPNSRQSYFV
jgi:hypothetical protein